MPIQPLFIAGPCVIEAPDIMDAVAAELVRLRRELDVEIYFKASFDKANRTSIHSFRGPGLERGLQVLADIKERYGLPVVTDIHEAYQAAPAAEVADVLQIPAFLCRQTDLLVAAAKTGRTVNIKKAQFLSGLDMQYPVEKVLEVQRTRDKGQGSKDEGQGSKDEGQRTRDKGQGSKDEGQRTKDKVEGEVWLTERGNSFGYNNLVVDFRNIPDMLQFTPRVLMDCTHSVQRPGAAGGKTGGDRRFVPAMALAAKAFGATGYFMEVHPDPDRGLSDGPNMLALADLENVMRSVL